MTRLDEFNATRNVLQKLAAAVEENHQIRGLQSSIANQARNAAENFHTQPTINDAIEGRNKSRRWELPRDFNELCDNWISAHWHLATQNPTDEQSLGEAVTKAAAATEALITPLYRAKERRS